ncbi:MAG: CHAT domain-containing protein [Lewinellaceae bacterium]|nr:CHAT domain-containing protein [Lewinellaceae bacterium]
MDSLLAQFEAQKNAEALEAALATIQSAEALALSNFGEANPAYASCLYRRGLALFLLGRFDESVPLFQKSIEIREAAVGRASPENIRCLAGLGKALGQLGDPEKGEALLLEAKTILTESGRDSGMEYATLLSDFSHFYFAEGDIVRAKTTTEQSLKLREDMQKTDGRSYAENLQSLAMIFNRMGDYPAAEGYFTKAKSALAETVGTTHPAYAACLLDFAINYQLLNDFSKAEALLVESMEITVKTKGKASTAYAQNAEGLANLYTRMGNFEKARPLYLECKEIQEKNFGKTHPKYGASLANLAGNYYMAGDLAQAENYSEQALGILENTVGKGHYFTMSIMQNLSMLYEEQGKYAEAEPMMEEVLELLEKNFGTGHPGYAVSLMNLAHLKLTLGHYAEAEQYFRQGLEIFENASGKETLEYTNCLNGLISLKAKTGEHEEALALLRKMGTWQKRIIARGAQHLTESEMAAYLPLFSDYFNQYFSTLEKLRPTRGAATAEAFDDAIFYKGYLLENASRVKKFSIQDPTLSAQYEELAALQTALAAEYAKPPAARSGIAEMEELANAIEKKLVASATGYREIFQQVTWQEVQQNLQPGEAALEFIHYNFFAAGQMTDNIRYAAIVLRAGSEFPDFVPLFEERDLAGLLEGERGGRIQSINQLYLFGQNQPGSSLYALLWQPLETALSGARTVYYSPTGLLHRLNLEAIQNENGAVLGGRFQLIKMGSTRQLAMPGQVVAAVGSAELFGGIEYGPDSPSENLAGSATYPSQGLAGRNAAPADSTTLRLRGEKWDYLSWTKTEIEAIGLLTEGAGIPTTLYTGPEGSEEAVKKLGSSQPSPRILHLATHGYFFPSPEETAENGAGFQSSEHPMIRSGLILAGGNYAWKNGEPIRPGADDGILTAYEIAQLDLSQTELVVLSACETGLGDIRGNEGVYGLQRAFKFAGAKYVLMSLWQVPDFQTQELMTAFYYNWLEEGMDIPAAFRNAQAELRRKYPSPFLWAGFVLNR